MKKLIEFIEKGKPFFEKLSRNIYLRAIRDGFIQVAQCLTQWGFGRYERQHLVQPVAQFGQHRLFRFGSDFGGGIMVNRKLVGAHYGLRDWAMQRITAVVMLVYSLFFLFFLFSLAGAQDYSQ